MTTKPVREVTTLKPGPFTCAACKGKIALSNVEKFGMAFYRRDPYHSRCFTRAIIAGQITFGSQRSDDAVRGVFHTVAEAAYE